MHMYILCENNLNKMEDDKMLRKFTNKELSEIKEIEYAKKVLNEDGAYSYQIKVCLFLQQ